MKLTKGKISKLYNKKKQSLKKKITRKKSNKIRTFRNKPPLNLARKSLKRFNYKKYRGGGDGEDGKIEESGEEKKEPNTINSITTEPEVEQPKEVKPQVVEPGLEEVNPQVVEPGLEEVQPEVMKPGLEEVQPEVVEPGLEQVQPEVVEPGLEQVQPEVVEPGLEQPEVVEPSLEEVQPEVVEPGLEEVQPEVVEPGLEQPDVVEPGLEQPEVVEPEATETELEQAGIEHYGMEQPKEESKPQNEPKKQQFIESLGNVITYISDSIAEKMSQQTSLYQSNDGIQNGFNSVNKAVKTMATSGGKKKKTVHFRITNKNNTRKML